MGLGEEERIVVCVRKRPMSQKELVSSQDCIICEGQMVSVRASRTRLDGWSRYEEDHCFGFDKVFGEEQDSFAVYGEFLSPLVRHVSEGGQSTCFA